MLNADNIKIFDVRRSFNNAVIAVPAHSQGISLHTCIYHVRFLGIFRVEPVRNVDSYRVVAMKLLQSIQSTILKLENYFVHSPSFVQTRVENKVITSDAPALHFHYKSPQLRYGASVDICFIH